MFIHTAQRNQVRVCTISLSAFCARLNIQPPRLNIETASSPSFQNQNQQDRKLRMPSGLSDLAAVLENSID
jgi:hypothetical protein